MSCDVIHLTTVHGPNDTRIYHRECRSLAGAGWKVKLVAPGPLNLQQDDVDVQPLPMPRTRLARVIDTGFRAYRAALRSGSKICHIHDPELLPVALMLRLAGRAVVYDAHEDLRATVAYKHYLPGWCRSMIGWLVGNIEGLLAARCTAIIAATPGILERFGKVRRPIVTVQNFPRIEEFTRDCWTPYGEREPNVVYVGAISKERGLYEMIEAMQALGDVPARLKLAGAFAGDTVKAQRMSGWERVDALGVLDRSGLADLLARARIGLVVLHPEKNYVNAYATKMFEYMAAGIPVVASDFPLWRKIVVEESGCGLVVDPLNPAAIADAIKFLLTNETEAEAMGTRGRDAVVRRFNWSPEETKLLALYRELGAGHSSGRTIRAKPRSNSAPCP